MAEFETEGVLSVVVDQSSLDDARDEVEQSIGSVSVDAEASARTDGGAMGGVDTGSLVSLSEDRNDILEDILDELEDGAGGGGRGGLGGAGQLLEGAGGRGGGGGAGGGLSSLGRTGGGLISGALTAQILGVGNAGGLVPEGEPAMSSGPVEQGLAGVLSSIFPETDRPPIEILGEILGGGGGGGASETGGQYTEGLTGGVDISGAGAGGDAPPGDFAPLNVMLDILTGGGDPGMGGGSGDIPTRPSRTTGPSIDPGSGAGGGNAINVEPQIDVAVDGLSDLQRALERGLEDAERNVLNELKRELSGSGADIVGDALQTAFQRGF